MKATSLLLLGLLVLAPSSARSDELFEAIYALVHPDEARQAAARQTLVEAGPAGFQVVVAATRMLGASAPSSVALRMHCPLALGSGFHSLGGPQRSAPGEAAALFAEMTADDPSLAESLLRSPYPEERKLGLLGLAHDAGRLAAALEPLRGETDTALVEFGRAVVPCAMVLAHGDRAALDTLMEAARALQSRREEMLPPTRCEEAGFTAGPVLDALLAGRANANGWSRSANELSILVTMPEGVRVLLSPRCAFDLYDAARRQDRVLPALVMPFVEERTLEPAHRSEALLRAERDVTSFPADQRNWYAARLVNAGGQSAHRVTFDAGDPFAQEELLEAAARQGQPQAWRAIEQATFCRGDFGDSERIELLGFVGTREAADTAAELARRCPRARGAATVALIRLGDARAKDFLADALEDPGFSRDTLERALFEHLTRPLAAELLRAAAQEGIRGITPRELVERLRAAGKLE